MLWDNARLIYISVMFFGLIHIVVNNRIYLPFEDWVVLWTQSTHKTIRTKCWSLDYSGPSLQQSFSSHRQEQTPAEWLGKDLTSKRYWWPHFLFSIPCSASYQEIRQPGCRFLLWKHSFREQRKYTPPSAKWAPDSSLQNHPHAVYLCHWDLNSSEPSSRCCLSVCGINNSSNKLLISNNPSQCPLEPSSDTLGTHQPFFTHSPEGHWDWQMMWSLWLKLK